MDWFSKNKFWLTGAGLSLLSAIARFMAANQTPHPTGWDGYYYVMQVQSWLEFGYLQSPDFSLIYPFLTVIAGVVGSPVLGFKIGVAMLSGILTAVVFNYKRDMLLLALYVAASPLITYFILQFPKNTLGLIFLILCLQSRNRWLTFLFFFATLLTHRMTGAFAIIATGIYSLRHVSWQWIVTGALAVIAISALPGIIHISDFARFNDQFTWAPHWAPLAFFRIFPNSLSWLFKLDLFFLSCGIVLTLVSTFKRRKSLPFTSWMWLPIALISIFPFFSFSAGDAGHRFFLVAPVAFIMLLPPVYWHPKVQWMASSGLLVVTLFSWRSYKPGYFDPPNDRYAYIVGKLVTRYDHKKYPLVIAHKSLAEMIIFKTDFDALNWLPPEDIPAQNVLRLINGVNYTDLRKHMDEADRTQLRSIASGYFALPEDVWQRFLASVQSANDDPVMKRIVKGRNPIEERPYYLNKGKIR